MPPATAAVSSSATEPFTESWQAARKRSHAFSISSWTRNILGYQRSTLSPGAKRVETPGENTAAR